MFRKAIALIAGVTVVAVRILHFFKRSESPETRERLNNLVYSTLDAALHLDDNPDLGLINVVLPAGITLLHNFNWESREVSPERGASASIPEISPSSFKKRLLDAGFDMDEIPEAFLDPISMDIIENPITAKTVAGHWFTFDADIFAKLNGVCPFDRQAFVEWNQDNDLKRKIAEFVTLQETKEKNDASEEGIPFESRHGTLSVAV